MRQEQHPFPGRCPHFLDESVLHCIALTKKHHIRHLPVVKEGRAIGMISLRDLFLDAIEERVGIVDEDE